MLGFDDGLMFSAIADFSHERGFEETGYLNRRTGEIVFVVDGELKAEAWYGPDVASDAVFDRAAVAASPEDWIEIPKYVRGFDGDNEEAFIHRFLQEHGLA